MVGIKDNKSGFGSWIVFICLFLINLSAGGSIRVNPLDQNYTCRKGITVYVSMYDNNTNGSSWKMGHQNIHAAFSAIPDDKDGRKVMIRPDTYEEANVFTANKGAKGAYNLIVGDTDDYMNLRQKGGSLSMPEIRKKGLKAGIGGERFAQPARFMLTFSSASPFPRDSNESTFGRRSCMTLWLSRNLKPINSKR